MVVEAKVLKRLIRKFRIIEDRARIKVEEFLKEEMERFINNENNRFEITKSAKKYDESDAFHEDDSQSSGVEPDDAGLNGKKKREDKRR